MQHSRLYDKKGKDKENRNYNFDTMDTLKSVLKRINLRNRYRTFGKQKARKS